MPYLAMTHFPKHSISSLLKRVFSNSVDSPKIHSLYSPRFYSRKATAINSKEAQSALLDYFHYTRNLPFIDAESMSNNCPDFLQRLLQKVGAKNNVGKSLSKYLRYSPINEFEPFYESLGLNSHEYSAILPRDLMFLSDDELLMENYNFLCNYGIERKNIGKIVKEACEVFRYEYGALALKLEAYEQLGLSRSFVAKMVVCSPYLLIGNVNADLVQVMLILRNAGINLSLIEQRLSENTSYNWSRLLALLELFRMRGYSEDMLGCLINLRPGILFEDSGNWTLLLIGFLTKFGCNNRQICSVFEGFPKLEVALFVANTRRSFQILNEIGFEETEIGMMFSSHALLLGSYKLKTVGTMMTKLGVSKERLCNLIFENPQELRNLKVGSKVGRLPKVDSVKLKITFLMELGFTDEPNKTMEALKNLRGSGAKIQERFDCLVEAGLDKKDVCRMVKLSPQILSLSKDIIKDKIDFLVNDLGYPLSLLVTCPSYFKYARQRVKLRLAMYGWLKDEGRCDMELSWNTLLSYSDKTFLQRWVKPHPKGLEVFEDLKRKIYSDSGVDPMVASCWDKVRGVQDMELHDKYIEYVAMAKRRALEGQKIVERKRKSS